MKKSWTLISLAAALAGSTALASPNGAPAGTIITNVANIYFTPDGGDKETSVPSNEVVTTVLPVPSFTIAPNDGSSDATKPDYSTPGQTATVKPCDKDVSFLYTLTNTGNVPKESYTLSNTPDPSGKVKAPENIRYYLASADTNSDGKLSADEIKAATPITTITGVNQANDEHPEGKVKFFQVYDIPCNGSNADVYGADPTGTRTPQSDASLNPATPVPQDANNSNTSKIERSDAVLIGPKNDPDGNGNPVTAPYQSGDAAPVTITPTASDTQVAQATTTTTTVTFTNTVQNKGNRDDVLNIVLEPGKDLAGFPAGTKVTLENADGTPLADHNKDGIPDVGTVNPDGTADILVKVEFPAGSQPAAGSTPTATVHVVSSNDPTKSDPTKDIVNLPGLAFGDPSSGIGGDASPVGTPPTGTTAEFPNGSGNPGSPILPPAQCTAPIRTYLPMEVGNTGSAPDLYNIEGTAPIKLTSGSVVNTPITYYKDVNGDGKLDGGDTVLTDTNGDGKLDTGLIAPGSELKLIAALDVPCDAASQTITLTQSAKSPTTNAEGSDKNDTITVGLSGTPTVIKKVDKTQAKPGETLNYTIDAKNSSNGNVTAARVCDKVNVVSTLVSYTATTTAKGTVLYNVNGGTWQKTPFTTAPQEAVLCAAVDTSDDGNVTTADILKPGESINVTFQQKINDK